MSFGPGHATELVRRASCAPASWTWSPTWLPSCRCWCSATCSVSRAPIATCCTGGATIWSGFDDPEFGGGDVDAYRRTFAEAFTYALELAAERRARPQPDLISRLAVAEVTAGGCPTANSACSGCCWWWPVTRPPDTFIAGSLSALVDDHEQR